MSDLDNAINSINASAAKAENTATFLDDMSTLDDQSSVTNPNNGQIVASIPKQVKDRTDVLFAAAESDINQAVADAAQSATDAQDAADSIGRYQGLWPDTGGGANKGDTYQTQVSGTPTGQYFTALQNTTVDPIGDDVNWRVVVSVDSIPQYTNIVYRASGGNSAVENMIAGIPVKSKVGDKISTGLGEWERVSDLSGDESDFKPISINVFDFYKPSDGVTYDNAAVRCFDYYKSQQSEEESATKIGFPPFRFKINSLSCEDLYDTELDFNGALVFAIATQPTTAALRIKNYNNIKISNLGALYSSHNPNYSYGAWFTGGAGGTIDPSVGLGKELIFSNSSVLRFASGVKIGDETLDTNHGQNLLSNVHIKECNQGLIAAGSQTIVSVTGGSIASGGQDVYGISDNEKIAVIAIGGAVVLNSTEILRTSGIGYGVGVTNCLSDTYENQYGSVIANGLYIEATSIARIYATGDSIVRSSAKSCLSLNEVTGAISGASKASVICVADDYSGRIDLGSGNMYGFGGVRTAVAVDVGNSSAEVNLGKRFFRSPYFESNLEEVIGGVMNLDNDMIFRAQNLSSQTITNAGGIIKFNDIYATGRFARYSTMYSSASGVVTIPKGGFLQMTIELGISSNTFDGIVSVIVNGTTRYKFYTNLRMDFSTTLYDLLEGDELSVKVEPSSTVTFGEIATDYIQITATR